MWFRDKNGVMRYVLRNDFHTDSEYYDYISNICSKKSD
jgi:hypothetical protein